MGDSHHCPAVYCTALAAGAYVRVCVCVRVCACVRGDKLGFLNSCQRIQEDEWREPTTKHNENSTQQNKQHEATNQIVRQSAHITNANDIH